MRFIFSIFLFIQLTSAVAYNFEPKNIDYEGMVLGSPMDIPLILAGNFCEMRSNHWHTGLDIKTNGREGEKLRAIEEGYISRIKVSPWGYGLALYVDHPNGLTSVYAHISKWPTRVDSLVYAKQQANESWVLDENVLADSFYVKKGELIAYSGNTGGSTAPHLHFEIRETKTEHVLNPLKFKCYRDMITDKVKPTLSGIKVYAVNQNGYMIPGRSKYYSCSQINGQWIVNDDNPIDINELLTENGYLAFGFHTTDRLDAAHNVCGVHHTYLYQEDNLIHEQISEYMIFDVNRFINSHQDYFEFKQNRRNIHKNFITTVNPMPMYPTHNGLIPWERAKGKYKFTAVDVHGNKNTLSFKIGEATGEMKSNPFDETDNYYFPDSVNVVLYPNFQLLMEPGTFYEPLQKTYRVDSNSNYLTPKHAFSEYSVPVQKYFDVRMKVPDSLESIPVYKLGIGLYTNKGYLQYLGGDYVDGWVEAKSRYFGEFVMVVDSVPPLITPTDYNENKTITKYRTLELTINDNLSGVVKYKAFLNGKWVVMKYFKKKRKYVIPLNERSKMYLKSGKNIVRIWAKDRAGNESENATTVIY
jgi:hypothetical protein